MKKSALNKRFDTGDDLLIEYRFISFHAGSRVKRYMLSGIGNWGEGTLQVEAIFKTRDGVLLSRIQSDGRIGSGIMGGSIRSALERAAEEVSRYAGFYYSSKPADR